MCPTSTDTTQEELSEAMAWFGKYERLVTRMFHAFIPSSEQLDFLSGCIIGPGSKYSFFVYFERGSCQANIAYLTMGSYHPLGARPTHRTRREPPIHPDPWGFG
jgi:hypothetical protein